MRGSKKCEINSVMDNPTIVFFLFIFSTSIKEDSSSIAWDMFKICFYFLNLEKCKIGYHLFLLQ